MVLDSLLELLIFLFIEVKLFIEYLIEVIVFFRESMSLALEFQYFYLELSDIFIMFLNEESSISLESLI